MDIELDWHGLGDPEGTDVAVCTAPFQVYMPHLISSERFLKGRQGLQKQNLAPAGKEDRQAISDEISEGK